jgi:PAS domain S-box-containing protein
MTIDRSPTTSIALEDLAADCPEIVTTETELTEAIALLNESQNDIQNDRANCILVRDGLQLVGILTERDLLKLAIAGNLLEGVKVAEVMSKNIVTLKKSDFDNIFTLIHLFDRHCLEFLPIVDDSGEAISLFTLNRLLQALRPSTLFKLRRVKEVMSTQFVRAPLSASLLDLARLLVTQQASCIAIAETQGDRSFPLGIVTPGDLIQFQIRGLDLGNISAESAIDSPLSVDSEENLWVAEREMQRRGSGHLVVTNSRGELLGLLTQASLLRVFDPQKLYDSVRLLERENWQLRNENAVITQQQNRDLQQEILKHQETEVALQTAKEQLEAVLDAVPATISWISSDLRYLGVNKQLASLLNLPVESFVGKTVGELNSHHEFLEYLSEFFASSVEQATAEFNLKGKNSNVTYLVVAKKYQQGSAAVLVGIEISDRRLVEEELRRSEERFRAIFEQVAVGMVEASRDGRFLKVNHQFCTLLGYSERELLQKTFFDIIRSDDLAADRKHLAQILAGNISSLSREQPCLNKNGTIVWVNANISIVKQTKNEGEYLIVVIEDISERKQAEEDIRKALAKEKELNQLKSDFISMTSHEFRTPLTSILGATQLLKHYSHNWSEEKKNKYLSRIQNSTQHMTRMLEDILVLGRTESGQLKFNPARCNLDEFCSGTIEELTMSQYDRSRIIYNIDLQSSKQPILDEKLLKHIVGNLLSNALKYSSSDTKVNFDVIYRDDRVVFQIKDRGIGIELEDREKLFDSFYRGRNVGQISGTGLGLTIVKNALDLHGGQLEINSQLGVGTTVTVTIPANSY